MYTAPRVCTSVLSLIRQILTRNQWSYTSHNYLKVRMTKSNKIMTLLSIGVYDTISLPSVQLMSFVFLSGLSDFLADMKLDSIKVVRRSVGQSLVGW